MLADLALFGLLTAAVTLVVLIAAHHLIEWIYHDA